MPSSTPLDDVAVLARSPHRVAVLATLRTGPRSRPDLHDETDISQPTLGRVLGSLQDRHWVEREGREYGLTPGGALVAMEFANLLEAVETVQRLSDVIGLLPTKQLGFDLRLLGDATVVTPETGDAFRHVRRVEELVYGADDLRLLSTTMPPGTSEDHANQYEDFLESDRVVESVITADTLDRTLADPRTVEWLEEAVALDRARLYRYPGTIPIMAGVADGTAFLVPIDDQGLPVAVIETVDETVRTWVEETIDAFRAESTELTVDDVPT